MTRRTRLALAAAVGALLMVLGSTEAEVATAAVAETPPGRVLVIDANLQEAYGNHDLASMRELAVFAGRVLQRVPARPDVFLLQEVRRKSARRVARLFTLRTGNEYVVAVKPGRRPSHQVAPHRYVHTETAILLNKSTMERLSGGGFVKGKYAPWARARGSNFVIRRFAFVLARERASGMRLPLASLHFNNTSSFRSRSAAQFYKNKWSKHIANNLRRRYGHHRNAYVVAGDFNQDYCAFRVHRHCHPHSTFYKTLKHDPYDFTDAVRRVIGGHGVDMIFTNARVRNAGKDENYNWHKAIGHRRSYYADHQFRWAVIGRRS